MWEKEKDMQKITNKTQAALMNKFERYAKCHQGRDTMDISIISFTLMYDGALEATGRDKGASSQAPFPGSMLLETKT